MITDGGQSEVLAPLMKDAVNLESVLGLYLLVVILPDPFFNATVFSLSLLCIGIFI